MSSEARRAALSSLTAGGDHPGLAFTRLLPEHDGEHGSSRNWLADIAKRSGSDSHVYRAAFVRWKAAAEGRDSALFTATLLSPMALGLGNASPHEVGLTLHHTYGLPVLPGTALKGLCRRIARRANLSADEREHVNQILFGNTDAAGYIGFSDGWLIPDSRPSLMLDTITVHHPEYYGSRGKKGFPTDFDDPDPLAFLAVCPGLRFQIAVEAPDPQWGAFATHLLAAGLRDIGLGGKTNAGYGFFDCTDVPQFVEKNAGILLEPAAPEPLVPQDIEQAI